MIATPIALAAVGVLTLVGVVVVIKLVKMAISFALKVGITAAVLIGILVGISYILNHYNIADVPTVF